MACATLKRSYDTNEDVSKSSKRSRNNYADSSNKLESLFIPTSNFGIEEIAQNIARGAKLLHRTKQLKGYKPGVQLQKFLNQSSEDNADIPVLTAKQAQDICESIVKEREIQLRQEFTFTLTNKIGEQYNNFIRSNHNNLSRKFSQMDMSYVS